MTEQEQSAFADRIIAKLHSVDFCPNGMDKETVIELKKLLPSIKEANELYSKATKGFKMFIVGSIVLGFFVLCLTGLWQHVKSIFKI